MTAPPDNAGAVELPAAAGTRVSPNHGLLRAAKWLTVLLVLGAIVWQFRKLSAEWGAEGAAVLERGVTWPWLVASLAFFAAGQFCFAWYWRRLLHATGIDAPLVETVRAYLVGTLGKYVPGKALVIVVRSGMLPSGQGRRLTVGATTIYETMSSMAAGGLIACVALAATDASLVNNITGAATIALLLNFAVFPTTFERLSRWAAMPFGRDGGKLPIRAWYRCYGRSAPIVLGEWLGSGLSLWAVAAAFQLDVWSIQAVVYMTGTTALATAAGFLVLPVPAGIGVREFIMIMLLEKWFAGHVAGAHATAVAVSLMLRTVWTAGELTIAGGLYALPGVSWARARAAEALGGGAKAA